MTHKIDISYALAKGTELKNGTYTIQKIIGAGGMETVCKSKHINLDTILI